MRIRNQHPDAHAAKKYGVWNAVANPDGKGYITYTNPTNDYATFTPFRFEGSSDGMNYLLRTSGYDPSWTTHWSRFSDGSFVCTKTKVTGSDVWVESGKSCTPVEYCIVTPVEFNVLQAVGIGCFTGDTAPY